MIRTNNAAKKSAKAIATGTILSVVYAWATHESLVGPMLMGVGAMVGLCTHLFFYEREAEQK